MTTEPTGNENGRGLGAIVAMSVAVFATAYVVAAVGYPSWMWVFVFAGLVLAPVVAVAAAVLWLVGGPARVRRSGRTMP